MSLSRREETSISDKNIVDDTCFAQFVLSHTSDNTTFPNIGGRIQGPSPTSNFGATVPPVPLSLRPCCGFIFSSSAVASISPRNSRPLIWFATQSPTEGVLRADSDYNALPTVNWIRQLDCRETDHTPIVTCVHQCRFMRRHVEAILCRLTCEAEMMLSFSASSEIINSWRLTTVISLAVWRQSSACQESNLLMVIIMCFSECLCPARRMRFQSNWPG